MLFRLSTLNRSKTIELHDLMQDGLYAHATNTRIGDILGHCFNFDTFRQERPSTVIRYVCVFALIHFQGRFQIDGFSMKTLSVLL